MDFQRKIRILFLSEAVTLAHLIRPLVLSKELDPALFEINFASRDTYPFVWNDFKVRHYDLNSPSPEEFQVTLSSGGVLFDKERLDNYVKAELILFEKIKPDLVIGDLRPSLSVSAVISNIPYINITNAYWSPYALLSRFPVPCSEQIANNLPKGKTGRAILKLIALASSAKVAKVHAIQGEGLNQIRQSYKLRPFDSYLAGFTAGDITLYADLPALVPTINPPSNNLYIGPIDWSPNVARPSWWSQIEDKKPLVYVNLGSSGWQKVIPIIVESLLSAGFYVMLGSASKLSGLPVSSRLYVTDLISGSEACNKADLVVCNGGSPTVYQALISGTPVIGIPCNMDQLLFMQYVERSKIGISLRVDTICKKDIISSAEHIISNAKFRDNIAVLRSDPFMLRGANKFQDIVLSLVGNYGNQRVSNL